MKLRVSSELPEYLRSKFTQVVPCKLPRELHYKTVLKQTVSPEAPNFFRVKSVPVLSLSQQAQVKLGSHYNSQLAHSGMKSQLLGRHSKLNYEDRRDSQYKLTLARVGNLRVNQRANGSHQDFHKAHSVQLCTGFNIQRGEHSKFADHVRLTRPLKPKLDFLKVAVTRQLGKALPRKSLHIRR